MYAHVSVSPYFGWPRKGGGNADNDKNHLIASLWTERMDSSGCSVCELQFSRKGAVVRHCFAHFRLSVLALFLRIKCESCAGGYEVFFIAIYYNNISSYITVKKKKKIHRNTTWSSCHIPAINSKKKCIEMSKSDEKYKLCISSKYAAKFGILLTYRSFSIKIWLVVLD